MDSDLWMVHKRLARLRLALLMGGILGAFSVVCDLLSHAYSVAVSGCPNTIESFINCGGRGPHMELLYALGILCFVAFALLVGWTIIILIRGGSEDG